MASCYYCSAPVDDTDLYPLQDTYVRVCPECRAIINMFGQDVYETKIEEFGHDVAFAKKYLTRNFAQKPSESV